MRRKLQARILSLLWKTRREVTKRNLIHAKKETKKLQKEAKRKEMTHEEGRRMNDMEGKDKDIPKNHTLFVLLTPSALMMYLQVCSVVRSNRACFILFPTQKPRRSTQLAPGESGDLAFWRKLLPGVAYTDWHWYKPVRGLTGGLAFPPFWGLSSSPWVVEITVPEGARCVLGYSV